MVSYYVAKVPGKGLGVFASDRYSLIAFRDIAPGEELTNDYNDDDDCPEYFEQLYEEYKIDDGYLAD